MWILFTCLSAGHDIWKALTWCGYNPLRYQSIWYWLMRLINSLELYAVSVFYMWYSIFIIYVTINMLVEQLQLSFCFFFFCHHSLSLVVIFIQFSRQMETAFPIGASPNHGGQATCFFTSDNCSQWRFWTIRFVLLALNLEIWEWNWQFHIRLLLSLFGNISTKNWLMLWLFCFKHISLYAWWCAMYTITLILISFQEYQAW